jgi:quinohemoprotein ethanol dehydrogenase
VPQGSNRLLAWDPVAQREAWSVPLQGAKNGAIMSTAGNLVFQGNVTGNLSAYAADSGRLLWSFDAHNGILAQPISYMAGGRQYITVLSGWRMTGTSGPGLDWDYRTQRRRVLTFAIGGSAELPEENLTPPPLVDDAGFRVEPALAQQGAALYARRCQLCHGPALAAGGAAPDLRRSAIPLDHAALDGVVREGVLRDNGMPQFAELSSSDMTALQHYIRQTTRAAIAAENRRPARRSR